MYKKLLIADSVKLCDGTIIGKQVGYLSGRIVIEDDKGNQKIGIYACLDNKGKLHELCKNTQLCGQNCFLSNSPSCRYNRKFQDKVGYYAWID